jgi:hypothetical protein
MIELDAAPLPPLAAVMRIAEAAEVHASQDLR